MIKVLHWDCDGNIWEVVQDIAKAINGIKFPILYPIEDTGSDQYVVVVSDRTLRDEEIKKAWNPSLEEPEIEITPEDEP